MVKDLICPYCGFEQDVKDVSDWVNHDGDTTNHECEKCKKSFKIKANISIDFEVINMQRFQMANQDKKENEEHQAKLNNNGNVSISPVYQQNNLEDFNGLNPFYYLNSDELASGVNKAIEIAIGDSEE